MGHDDGARGAGVSFPDLPSVAESVANETSEIIARLYASVGGGRVVRRFSSEWIDANTLLFTVETFDGRDASVVWRVKEEEAKS